jgi:hypothetical protein
MKLTLPLPPNRANARGHWRKIQREKEAYDNRAHLELFRQFGAFPFVNVVDPVNVTATLYVWSVMDDDNCVARLKWPLDCLKRYGLIVDDKHPHCTLTGIPEQVIDRKNQRVEIELNAA